MSDIECCVYCENCDHFFAILEKLLEPSIDGPWCSCPNCESIITTNIENAEHAIIVEEPQKPT